MTLDEHLCYLSLFGEVLENHHRPKTPPNPCTSPIRPTADHLATLVVSLTETGRHYLIRRAQLLLQFRISKQSLSFYYYDC